MKSVRTIGVVNGEGDAASRNAVICTLVHSAIYEQNMSPVGAAFGDGL
jgi:hypothetical protein